MGFKKLLQRIYLWPLLPPERVDFYQSKIRRAEWEAVKPFIKKNSTFLDVGCGAGYNLKAAATELNCIVQGIDPEPGAHGVGRYSASSVDQLPIDQGFAEKLPYESERFEVVFSSHVLEHVNSIPQSLSEMKRVMKNDGTLIIGMPSATMGWIGLFSQMLFTTHMRWYNFFMHPFVKTPKTKFKFLFLPPSHSEENKTALYDISHYKAKTWAKHIQSVFVIHQVLLPALYPYPDFRQLFTLRKSTRFGSSVFFICSKPS